MKKWYHSCCGKPSGKCQGCHQNMKLVSKDELNQTKKDDSGTDDDKKLKEINNKIDEGIITVDDFNELISETTPESIRDRVRRRTTINPHQNHKSPEGHHRGLPNFNKRIMPKRKPSHQQSHGRSKIAHKHSAKTQRADALKENKYLKILLFIEEKIGKDYSNIKEIIIKRNINQHDLKYVINKMMALPNVDREWLSSLSREIDSGR